MSKTEELKLPCEFTEEELLLKTKYEELRKKKEQLMFYQKTGTCTSLSKITPSKKIGRTNQNDVNSKKTSDFKKSSKQLQQTAVKRSSPILPTEDDSSPRSVKIRGRDLTNDYLHKLFAQFGYISKIRTNEDKTCSVLTFKQSSSAVKSVEVLNGSVVGDLKLEVTLLRKNTSWCNIDINSSKLADMENRGKSVFLSFKGHLTPYDFEVFFETVGRITRIYLNEMQHFGFVMFENEEQARRAIKEMNGEIYNGIKIFVKPQSFSKYKITKPKTEPNVQHGEREVVSYQELEDLDS